MMTHGMSSFQPGTTRAGTQATKMPHSASEAAITKSSPLVRRIVSAWR